MSRMTTLLDLVNAVAEYSRSDAELIATVVYMVNRGHVRLCGTFKGSRFDLDTPRQPESGEVQLPPLPEGGTCLTIECVRWRCRDPGMRVARPTVLAYFALRNASRTRAGTAVAFGICVACREGNK